MIREATLMDVPRLVEMGRAFWTKSPWAAVGPWDAEKATEGMVAFVMNENVGVFVIEHQHDLHGAIAVLVADLWTVKGGLMAQELFWWVEPLGAPEARALWSAGEEWAQGQGAPVMAMIRLEGMRDDALHAMYVRRGYEVKEHLYTRKL